MDEEFVVQSDTGLRDLLERYRAQAAGEHAGREAVSVTLTRVAGFQNDVTAQSGHRLLVDEPANFGGGGAAPDPAELLLAAIAASLSVTLTAHAALRRIEIAALTMTLGAWMAAETFFDPAAAAEPGIQELTISLAITSRAPAETVTELVGIAVAASPVLQSLQRRPRLDISVQPA